MRSGLSQCVSDITVTEHLIQLAPFSLSLSLTSQLTLSLSLLSPRHITDTPASEREFLENLHELNQKILFVKEQDFNDCRAVGDVRDVVEKLKLKAVGKTREFLLQKVFQFRRPMANYQMLQNQLLNYRCTTSLFITELKNTLFIFSPLFFPCPSR